MTPYDLYRQLTAKLRSENILPAFFVVGGLAIFIWIIRSVWIFTIDDAFIFLRYARNLVESGKIVWNLGEGPVEGSTSFSWLLLTTIPHIFKFDAVVFIKVLGIIFTGGYLVVIYKLVEELRVSIGPKIPRLGGCMAVLLVLIFPATAIYAVAGLETPFFLFLVALFFYCVWLLGGENISKQLVFRTAIVAFFLGITRPDGNLIAVLGISVAIIGNPALRNAKLLKQFLWYILCGAIYFLWRYWYFGHLLPLPFYIKVAGQSLGGLPIVLEFVKFFGLRVGVPLVIGLSILKKRHLSILIPASAYLAFYVFPEHIMGQNFRFLAPVTLVVMVVVSLGLTKIYEVVREKKSFFIPITALVVLLLAWYAPGNIRSKQSDGQGLKNAHFKLAQLLKEADPTGRSTIAFADAGAVPYYSGWRVIDTVGLNEPHIATTGDHNPDYLLKQNVDMLILASKEPDTFIPILDWDRAYYDVFTKLGMEKLGVFRYDEGDNLWVIADPASEIGSKFLKIYKSDSF